MITKLEAIAIGLCFIILAGLAYLYWEMGQVKMMVRYEVQLERIEKGISAIEGKQKWMNDVNTILNHNLQQGAIKMPQAPQTPAKK